MTKNEATRMYRIKIYEARWSVSRLKNVRTEIIRDEVLSHARREALTALVDQEIDGHVNAYLDRSLPPLSDAI